MSELQNLSRREALGGLSGLVLGFCLPGCRTLHPPIDGTIALGPESGPPVDITAWVRISPDNRVTLRMGASEMGQGVFTALPMILAEELDLDWKQVRAETAPADKSYRRKNLDYPGKSQITGGSLNVRGYWDILREAGASARAMLVQAAADRWGVRPEDCRVEAGVVRCGGKAATYGELAEDAAKLSPPGASPKPASAWTLIGQSVPRLDLPPKVDGSATFGIDVQLPDMLVASVRHCPHFGGRLLQLGDAAARASKGVVEVLPIDEDKVVVVADTFWNAEKAARLLELEWDKGPAGTLDDEAIGRILREALDKGGSRLSSHGSLGELTGEGVIEAEYEVPYLEHMTLEPMNATAWVRPDRAEIWAPTQVQQMAQKSAAKLLGLPGDKVAIHTTFLGGGFGRKSETDFTLLAVKVARHFDRPVKVIWTREECFAHGFYRPRVLCRHRARLGPDGLPLAWHTELAGQNIIDRFLPRVLARSSMAMGEVLGGGFVELPYTVPAHRLDVAVVELPVPVGWWRSVQGTHNGFFRESFLDELAHAAGQDPIAYRRALLQQSPRHLAVFEAAVAEAGPRPEGLSRGVALFESFGSLCAHVADLKVEEGQVRVQRIAAAIDCGTAIHPDMVRTQVMGAATMGLGEALYGRISLREGAVQERNLHQYRLLTMAEAPTVSVAIVNSGEALGGVGEPGLPPIAGALGNAVFQATGRRIRSLPLAAGLG